MALVKCPHCGTEFEYSNQLELIDDIFDAAFVDVDVKLSSVDIPDISSVPLENSLQGKNVCFTGFSEPDKIKLKELAGHLGMNLKTSVSKKLDILVCGPSPGPSKMQKAEDLGVKIQSYDDFKNELTVIGPIQADGPTRDLNIQEE